MASILLDTCIWNGAIPILEQDGHQVEWCGSWPKDPGDEEILKRAFQQNQILVTLDKDFGNLAILQGQPHCGIIRLVGFRVQAMGPTIRLLLEKYQTQLYQAAIIVATPQQVRIRAAD